jgi:hypothetical protein
MRNKNNAALMCTDFPQHSGDFRFFFGFAFVNQQIENGRREFTASRRESLRNNINMIFPLQASGGQQPNIPTTPGIAILITRKRMFSGPQQTKLMDSAFAV